MTFYTLTHARFTLRASADVIVGLATAAYGSAGAIMRWLSEIGDLLTIGVNLVIAVGGVALLFHRFRLMRLERRYLEGRIEQQKGSTDER